MIWREKKVLLIVLGVLLAANTLFFFTYRVQYEERLASLEQRLEQAESSLTDARAARLAAERRVNAYRKIQRDIQQIYDERWATQDERLTALIAEVKKLAVASNLVPRAYSFRKTEQSASRQGTPGAVVVGISFTVQGSYEQVRRLINLLELSRQFVIIDQIALHAGNDQILTLNLQLKTLFRDETQNRPAASRPL
ncbi:MAG TPA: hypothetical protein VNL91_09305 [Thermoanaerobaculia bacterium]|nr:hypothetical protein [Thermoanaerobaculia bacterium]